ncbi:shikimate dehydrogenase [Flavobacterium sp. LS1P28]|uniref:shikimate dehydrogenase family protein n=1 Tax=unclassified Flavobacterium TaxID=196869 RepID=UPI000F83B92C|nr:MULTISPECIES: shikimate dehydrogenase [unclassified Flavobacterium]RTY89081.1 shikimate dehydrogenase [Flavobacterium sp. GSN2]RTY74669.1 shikimate dehydrogenase [Flavobacterium sp. LS1R10]RTY82225.1 shikimate dehydrogenase [Flavobacterium sp. ZB4P23]RTY82944.1 shikimate dehydrogenase [Flavobacterium sp. LS1P28]RTY87738.1 shikimate dehydrogenase [Flavobacterium sp. RSP15]
MTETVRKRFGLLGRNISYSFSKGYFTDKFNNENFTGCTYENFDIPEITALPEILKNTLNLKGLSITIPYKETVIPFLDKLSKKAELIGAVNTIKITKKGTLKGYNTDYYGFKKSLEPLLQPHHKKALILGTGGASKGVAFALDELDIPYTFVSREAKENAIEYNRINATTFDNYQIIINSTPVGTSPNVDAFPLIPYEFFTGKHIAFDLIYNPAETQFLKKAKQQGAQIKNGLDMLIFQAEKAWKIWNK